MTVKELIEFNSDIYRCPKCGYYSMVYIVNKQQKIYVLHCDNCDETFIKDKGDK